MNNDIMIGELKREPIWKIDRLDCGTIGSLKLTSSNGNVLRMATIELPWLDNRRDVSCIPEGIYLCEYKVSPLLGEAYCVRDVIGRSDILIHVGNFAGNVRAGLRSDVKGCILVGSDIGEIGKQVCVVNSKRAMESLLAFTGKRDILLTIKREEV